MNIIPFLEQQKHLRPTWAEVDLAALAYNYQQIKKLAGKRVHILPVVKGDAYGHGMLRVAKLLDRLGVNFFGVSDVTEGIILRKQGITKNILLFESTLADYAKEIVHYNLTPTICTLELARAINDYAGKRGRRADVHVDVDTGMGRLGLWHEDAVAFVSELMRLPNLSIKGIYTHFPSADSDRRFTEAQVKHLYQVVTTLDRKGLIVPYIHAANSMGLCGYRTRILNLARPGLMLYGLYPKPSLQKLLKLKPVLSVKSRVMFVKKVAKGRSVSYGRTFVASKEMMVATVSIGYRDGYLRCFSNRSSVVINGVRCPVIGRVTMDQIMIDVSRAGAVKMGSEAVILGNQGKAGVCADELADLAGTISYEIICGFGNRIPRIYK